MLYDQFLQEAWLDEATPEEGYPYDLPVVRALRQKPLRFHPKVTYLVGENGTGKSTLMEALAAALGFNPEGGSRNLRFSTRETHSDLHEYVHAARGKRAHRGYFFRAESFYNVASAIDDQDLTQYYGNRSLHTQSHGESFLALARNHFSNDGLFLLDEPEAALSPGRQLTILSILDQSIQAGSQYVIATHSPILMAHPDSWIYSLNESGLERVAYEDTEHVQITKNFLANPARMMKYLFED
ncbi:MAG: AAA family ATPase [Propionibacteriaceae bacterium]|jgi:predicted ATPase|nr:AAA family ATPase [Propionibacteriaceae bacterium]